MAGWDGIWGGLAAGAAVTALGLGALSITARQPAGNRPPEAPAVAPPDVAAPALADAAAVTSVSLAGSTAPTVLRPLVRPGPPPGTDGAGAGIDTTPAAIPEAVTPATALARPETGQAPVPPAGEARAPASAGARRPGVSPGEDAPAPPDASLAPASLPPDGDAAAIVKPSQPTQATMAPPAPIPVNVEVAPAAPASVPDPRPTFAGRSEGASAAARDRRPGAEVTRSAAPPP